MKKAYFQLILTFAFVASAYAGKNKQGVFELIIPGGAELTIDANAGGRITSLAIHDTELLTNKDVHAENYGSTFWTSPQNDWGWPPFKEIDNKAYKVLESSDTSLVLNSKPGKSGFGLRKHFEVNRQDSCLSITYTISNIANKELKVAPWEVTRVWPGGLSFCEKGHEIVINEHGMGITDTLGCIWVNYDSATISGAQKLYVDGKGWLAHVNHDVLFLKTFKDIHPEKAAPDEQEVELFLSGALSYIELENQGEYTILKPGSSHSWVVTWYVRKINKQDIAIGSTLLKHVEDLMNKQMIAEKNK
ncbi:MAG: DUF4380 domain-containing protein [Bacteroidales bacterium]|nr:DUF4380 domain-containing protein [Bacteroidales bacterium]